MICVSEQLTFFPETKEEKLERSIRDLSILCDKLRKSHYAEMSRLKHENKMIKEELEFIKCKICNQRYDLIS